MDGRQNRTRGKGRRGIDPHDRRRAEGRTKLYRGRRDDEVARLRRRTSPRIMRQSSDGPNSVYRVQVGRDVVLKCQNILEGMMGALMDWFIDEFKVSFF